MKRVLVVDDYAPLRHAMLKWLARAGYDALGVGNVAGARDAAGPWDLLVVDCRLPDGHGREVLAHWLEVPALTISGHDDEPCDLRKIFEPGELLAAVERKLKEA